MSNHYITLLRISFSTAREHKCEQNDVDWCMLGDVHITCYSAIDKEANRAFDLKSKHQRELSTHAVNWNICESPGSTLWLILVC